MKKFKSKIGAMVHIVFQSPSGRIERSIDLYKLTADTVPGEWDPYNEGDFLACDGAPEFFHEMFEKAIDNAKRFSLNNISSHGFKSLMSIFNTLVTYNHSIINIGTYSSRDGRCFVSSSIVLTAAQKND